jgi:predicted MPP superfamily phosphohydrolase
MLAVAWKSAHSGKGRDVMQRAISRAGSTCSDGEDSGGMPRCAPDAPPGGAQGAPDTSMTASQLDEVTYALLEQRAGRIHLRQRLGIEADYETRIFGVGRNFFHIENWYSIHSLIRSTLRMLLLHGRGKRNARDIRLRHNEIDIPALPAAFDGYTILHLTDMHLDMSPDIPHVLSDAVRDLNYDVCVLTGDIRKDTFGQYDTALDYLRQVRTHLKEEVYGVLGNHDTIRMVPVLETMGIRMLLNEAVRLDRGGEAIYLAGIDDPHYYRSDNIEKAAAVVPHEAVSILLAHSPEIYRHAAYADFDVLLCGHTHGGQICLPGGRPLMCNASCPREMCAGPWRYHGLRGYTSVGSGACVVDVRLNCPPEVTLHHLRRC